MDKFLKSSIVLMNLGFSVLEKIMWYNVHFTYLCSAVICDFDVLMQFCGLMLTVWCCVDLLGYLVYLLLQ
jgi:uncharacterized membrane protein YozB (DUF420 family)